MRRVLAWLTACIVGIGMAVTTPVGSAAASLRGAEAQRAIEAAMAHAGRSGVTFETDGRIHQRNATGDVAALVDGQRVIEMALRDAGQVRRLAPLARTSTHPRIAKAIRAAYGIGTDAFVASAVEPAEQPVLDAWFDPFATASAPGAEVVVDDAGRATQVRVDGTTVMRVLRWDAPLASRPARTAIVDTATAATVTAMGTSADFAYALLRQLAGIANRDAAYPSSPVPTLRRVARDTGWQSRDSRAGVTITITDALEATWRAALVAARSGVRVEEFALASHGRAMPEAQARARLALGVMAMGQSDLLSCPASCRLTGRPARYTVGNAEGLVRARLASIGIVGQTPGPDYPSVGDGMRGSLGLLASDGRFGGGFALSRDGFCLVVPLTGPGVLPRPTSYLATLGSVAPWGTCAR